MRRLDGFWWATAALLTMTSAGAVPGTDGHWRVVWQDRSALSEASLRLDGSGGTWRTLARSKNNPCVGREVPVRLELHDGGLATLTLHYSEVIPGCSNESVNLRIAPDGGLSGWRGAAELHLTREP